MHYTSNYELRLPEGLDDVDLSDINYNTDEIDGILKDQADSIESLQTALGEDEGDISDVKSALEGMEQDIGLVEQGVTYLNGQVNDDGGIADRLSAVETVAQAASEDCTALEQLTDTMGEDITLLEGTVSDLSDDVGGLTSTVSGHTSDIQDLNNSVGNAMLEIGGVKTRLGTDEGLITANATAIEQMDDRVDDLELAETAVDARLDALEAKTYRHLVCLKSDVVGYVASVIVAFDCGSATGLNLSQVLGYLDDWTECGGVYLNLNVHAIKVVSAGEVHYATADYQQTDGYEEATVTASSVFSKLTYLSIKEI